MYFMAPSFSGWSPMRQTGSDEIDSPPKNGGLSVLDDIAVCAGSPIAHARGAPWPPTWPESPDGNRDRERTLRTEIREMRNMRQEIEATERDALLVEDAALIRMVGRPVLEAVPSRGAPYGRTDPFILVHEGRFRLSEMSGKDTKHPHRGFDNLWYVLQGSASTGHTTGPDGSVERARLSEGALLALRTGRGAWHAESVGADEVEEGHGDTELRSVLFWVNLARKDKDVEPSAQVVQSEQIPTRREIGRAHV